MPQSTKERRSAPRRTDSAIRFRWLGAGRDEPVQNLSRSGAHLQTFRSAPVGSCVEFELLHADGVSIRLMGVVRRVERPGRGAASDGLLGLSVEFRDLDVHSERTMERWYQEATVGAADDPAHWGSEQGQDEAAKLPAHEGRLWDGGEAPEEPEDPAQLAAAASRAKETESILELQHRVARAEQLATEALEKLNRAEERILELEDQDVPESSSSEVVMDEPNRAEYSGEEAPASDAGAIMVDALSDSSEVHPPNSLGPNRFGFGQLGRNDAPIDGIRDEEADRPISGAVRSFSALAAKRMAEKSLTESTDAGGEVSEEGDLETRAFSLELLVAGKAASAVDTEVEQDSDEQQPETKLAELKPDSELENGPVATEQVWPDLEMEAAEPEAPQSDREVMPPELADAADAADAGEVFEEITEASDEPDDTDPESAVVMVVEELPPAGSSSSWADVGSEGEGASEPVIPAIAPRRASYREIPTLEGMLEAMAKGEIVRTERFSRLEPVSRVDIQVSDLLLECAQLSTLEEKTAGVVDRDQLHKVLFVFFQRDLIEVELLEG